MISVALDPDGLEGVNADWWKHWLQKSSEASTQAVEEADAGFPVAFQKEIWTDLKQWLLKNIFHGKCGYCESETEITAYAAADHYRPKGRIDGVDGHKGYYWVAYDWRNLVPCCNRCNTGAKRDKFPIAGTRASQPSDGRSTTDLNIAECPLLLSPYGFGEADPQKHLLFTSFGTVVPRGGSERGEISIDICNLQRETLKLRRRKNQESAWRDWLLLQVEGESKEIERRNFCARIRSGSIEHSAAVRDVIIEKSEQYSRELTRFFEGS